MGCLLVVVLLAVLVGCAPGPLKLEDESADIGAAAIGKLADQALLTKIARESKSCATRQLAIARLDDQAALATIAVDDSDLMVRLAAMERCEPGPLAQALQLAPRTRDAVPILGPLPTVRNLGVKSGIEAVRRLLSHPIIAKRFPNIQFVVTWGTTQQSVNYKEIPDGRRFTARAEEVHIEVRQGLTTADPATGCGKFEASYEWGRGLPERATGAEAQRLIASATGSPTAPDDEGASAVYDLLSRLKIPL
jgi:hypothetical protein